MSVTYTNFTVNGTIDSIFSPHTGPSLKHISNIEVQLWHQAPLEPVFLNKGYTDAGGAFSIDLKIDSSVDYIVDGNIENVFIKAYYKGVLLNPTEGTYDEDAQLYFDELVSEPSATFKTAVNTLVIQLKADGNWSKLDRFWIHAAEYQQHATVSLINPSSTKITESGTPAWTFRQGYKGNGTTSYLDTNFNPATQASQFLNNSGCLFYYSRTNLAEDSVDIGNGDASTGNKGSWLGPKYNSDSKTYARMQANSTAIGSPYITNTSGLLYTARTSASAKTYGRNGVQIARISETQTGISSTNFYVCGGNWGTALTTPSTRQIALTGIGSGAISQSTLYAAIQTFAKTLGFNV